MRIDKLEINNFRCFKHLELELHPRLNVLVGVNGSGKTALLEALKIGLIGAIGEIKGAVPEKTAAAGYKLDPGKDPRIEIFERGEWYQSNKTSINLTAGFGGGYENFFGDHYKNLFWSRALEKRNTRYAHRDNFKALKPYFDGLNEQLQLNADVALPIFAYYSTGRLFLEHNETKMEINGERSNGYINAHTAKSSQFLFKKWFEKIERGQNQYQKHGVSFDFSAFEKIKYLIKEFIPNCSTMDK
jgi:predicted ATP-binding protein involved in virulence